MLSEEDRKFFASIISPHEKKYLGFKVQEIAIIGSILIGTIGFYLRTNDTMSRLVRLSEYTQGFMENSDNYHATINGVQFKQGQPTKGHK